jgi:serine/threonine-protein kinase
VGQGRYRLEGSVGAGASGVVYAAWHTQLHRHVALKVLRSEYRADKGIVERFLNEARVAALIESENVVRVLDCGTLENGAPYLAMELLQGIPLSEMLAKQHHLPMLVAVEMAMQIASGLAAAHAKDVIHRDLKPENVMLVASDEFWCAKIVDFGIAKACNSDGPTGFGNVFGTPQYMSPEQTLGAAVDHRSDIYSLGVILYEMLSGKVPVTGKHIGEILVGQRAAPLAPLRSQAPARAVSPRLEAIVHRCLEKDPQRRYPSVQALLRDLRQFACRNGAANDNGAAALLELLGLSPNSFSRPSSPGLIEALAERRNRATIGSQRVRISSLGRVFFGCLIGAAVGTAASLWLAQVARDQLGKTLGPTLSHQP